MEESLDNYILDSIDEQAQEYKDILDADRKRLQREIKQIVSEEENKESSIYSELKKIKSKLYNFREQIKTYNDYKIEEDMDSYLTTKGIYTGKYVITNYS